MKTLRCAVVGIVAMASCHTSLAAVILFEGFNQATIPAGWSLSNGSWVSFVTSSTRPTAEPYEGTHFVKFNSYDASSGTRSFLTSPTMSSVGTTNVSVVFAWHRDSGYPSYVDRVNVQYSLDGTTWINVATYPRTNTVTGWEVKTCGLPAAATNQPTLYVGFLFYSAYGNNCYLDAVQVRGAMPGEVDPPTAFSATAASASHIDLQWQTNAAGDAVMIASNTVAVFGTPSNGVAYTVGSELPGGGGVVYQGATTALTLSGLQHSTRYYFRAWSVNGITNYSEPVSAAAVTDFVLPIQEGFNSTTVPTGWSISNTAHLTLVSTSTDPTANPYEGTRFVKFNSFSAEAGNRALLTSPRFSTAGGLADVLVDFAWHQDPGYADANDRMTVEWSSNGIHWVAAQTFYRVAPQTGWTLQRVILPAAALGHPRAQVRFNFLSQYGNNCYLDDVHIIGAMPNIYLDPTPQAGSGGPSKAVMYPLSVLNLTGGGRDVHVTYQSAWPANGPAATGVIADGSSTNIFVAVQIPANAIDSQSCTTTVEAVTADGQFTNTALLVTTCRWVVQPLCEWFEGGLGFWTNFFVGGVNNGWYWDSFNNAAAHDQETGGTNWFVSPAVDLNQPWAEQLTLSFWFGLAEGLLYPEGVYLVTGNRNPSLGTAVPLANLQYTPGSWHYNEIDLTPYITNVPVYVAFGYVSTNPWQLLTGICIDATKTGIDDAILTGPATVPPMTSYSATPTITGGVYIAGESGTGGPATLITAQVGFGPQGIAPDDALWTWYPATYLGAGGDYDLYIATPHLTIAGALNYCYRFRRGAAPWVYADLDGSSNGFDTNKLGTVTVAQLPPQGALLRNQTISLDYNFGPNSFRDQTVSPTRYYETADDLSLPYDAYITDVRMGGVYWQAGRQNLEQGFWLRIFANAVTNPGTLLYEQHVPGYACEEFIGVDQFDTLAYKYHINLTTQLLLTAGQTIWIALQHDVQSNTFWSLLDTPDAVRGNTACQTQLPTAWRSTDFDLGMEVYGVVTNAGTLNGTVRDAESMAPIAGAQVLITNTVYIHTIHTDSNGFYTADAPGGTYEIVVTKANYLPATAHGVVVTVGATTTMDFLLEGSYLSVAPTNVTRTMALGQQTVNTLVLSNSGPLDVHYTARIRNFGALTTVTKRITHVSLPPSDGNFPRGTAPLSLERAPRSSTPPTPLASPALAPLSSPVKAYGFNVYPAHPNALISLMTDNPGGYTTIGTANTGPSGFVCGAAFLNGDFSKLYCLVYADNRLVTVNTLNAAVTDVAACPPATGENWTGLAVDPNTGIMYASAYGAANNLYTLNPATGARTLVGQITNAGLIIGIAINAAGEMYGLDLADVLVRINKATGAGTVVGSIGFDANYAQDLAFDLENNVLYIAAYNNATSRGELRVADTTTGNTTLIGLFSATDMEVDGFETMTAAGARWARVETNAGAVAAGGTGTLNVIFDATVVSNFGDYTADLVFEGTFVNQLAPVPLKMTILAGPVISAPNMLNFGEVVIGDTTNLPLVIGNVGIGVLSGEITSVSAPFSVVGLADYTIPAGTSSTHMLSFTPAVEGVFTNVATLTGGGGATVTLIGTGIPEPALWLAALLLGMSRMRQVCGKRER